jgi:glutamine synthetase
MYDYAETMELDVDTLIHESGAGQLEVNFQHADAMSRADTCSCSSAACAKRRCATASMPPSSPSRWRTSPAARCTSTRAWWMPTGENVFAGDKAGQHSELFMHYLGGLQKYVPMAMPFFAPNVNSYRRLAIGQVAPINVQWGYDNRTCGLRVPMDSRENTRVESRFAGSDANPYLAMAATLACGYLGIVEKLQPNEPLAGSAQDKGFGLPRSLEDALIALNNCKPCCAPCSATASSTATPRSRARNTRPTCASSARGSGSSCC